MRKKSILMMIALCAVIGLSAFAFTACKEKETDGKTKYYVGASWNGYDAKGSEMTAVEGWDGFYSFKIDLTADDRDPTYDGHFYKVTNGTWDANGSYGTDFYELKPAPVKVVNGVTAGLGSIYVEENITGFIVLWDSVNKVIYDNSMVKEISPRIYGDFNAAMGRGSNWSTADNEALNLTRTYEGNTYSGVFKIPAYAGEGENGFSMATLTSMKYSIYLEYDFHGWGAHGQYKFDGTAAGMGSTSYLKPTAEANYEFTYNSDTKVTTYEILEKGDVKTLSAPVVYGDLSGWNAFNYGAYVMTETAAGSGVFTVDIELDTYTGTGEGYSALVVLSKEFYDDQYGIRWGAHDQYLFDGSEAGFGDASYLKPTVTTTYRLSYDSTTKITTVTTVDD